MRIDDAAWQVILGAASVPGQPPTTPNEILRHFGVEDGKRLGLDLMESTAARRDPDDLEAAMIVASLFGIDADHVEIYLRLATENWHRAQESITFQLGLFGDPRAVDVLLRLCEWVPDHLAWDDNRALASKAVHALARIPGDDAERALLSVLSSEDPTVRAMARRQHDKRTRQ
ncbi:HEAT repeat domain-containing protein [Nocardia puris]|uniref:HEAT repeat domain-containing protein n=1 Tax=Nocardia puris TaxID=208602 RepID=UPI001895D311|nr:HEAT repeat domain-containing protein [Nocardia puris]MBF6364482.1 HEAT repeat domain-containing protein [Nocardia puris]MBF6459411.1 HEAT repeat domain-containing protein [Nocardia puris]